MTATGDSTHILVIVGGGIAAYKTCSLVRQLCREGHEVTVIPTAAAQQFVGEATWAALSGRPVATSMWADAHEVPHIHLARSADLILVAPATADLMAKAAYGMADCLASAVLLSATCPVVMAAAMHTEMWRHPATVANVARLRERDIQVLDPEAGALAGGDHGVGRMVEPDVLVLAAAALLSRPQPVTDLAGRHVVVSAGGTREPLDPVRFISNHSSGAQGFALAAAAAARGAQVSVVAAHTDREPPAGVRVESVSTALQLHERMLALAPSADAVMMAAAVADYRPQQCHDTKQKKTLDADGRAASRHLELVPNPDIVADLVAQRAAGAAGQGEDAGPVIVAFAAETGDRETIMRLASEKLQRKGCDLIVANDVSGGKTFGSADTEILILGEAGHDTGWMCGSKMQAAHHILDSLVRRLP